MSSVLRPNGVISLLEVVMIVLKQIQEKLAEAIKLSGMSQTAIAKKLGISQQTVSHYVRGDKMPALDTFANLCELLDIDANDILCVTHKYK